MLRTLPRPPAARRAVAAAATTHRLGPALAALALGGFAIGTTEFVAMGLLPRSTSAAPAAAIATVFLLGLSIVLRTGLQMRLMDVAGESQTLAASLNHSAFNVANALGAWLGGVVLAAGLGLTAPMWVAVGLSFAGMAIFVAALTLERRGPVQLA